MNYEALKKRSASAKSLFFYEKDFDSQDGDNESEVQNTFSAADLHHAEQRSRSAGFEEAMAISLGEQQRAKIALLTSITAAVESSKTDSKELIADTAGEIAKMILAMAAVLLPDYCARYGPDETLSMVKRLIPALRLEPKLTVQVHESSLEEIRQVLLGLAPELRRSMDLSLLKDSRPGDIQVSWKEGGASRSVSDLEMHLNATLETLGLMPDRSDEAAAALRSGNNANSKRSLDIVHAS